MPYIGNTPADKFLTLAKQSFSTSATTSYTLDSAVSSTQDIALFINNVRQSPVDAYSVSGTSLTLTSATAGTDEMYCVYLGKTVGTVSPSVNSITNAMMTDDSVGLAELSATGTPSSSNFLRGDNAWATAGGDNEPMFHATLGADTTVSHDTLTVTPCDNTTFNLGSAYSTSTYKFTPQTAGKYYIYTYAQCNFSAGEAKFCIPYIVKNSTTIVSAESSFTNSSASRLSATAVAIVDLNGSSDYVQAKVLPGTGSGTISLKSDSDTKTNFGGFKLLT